ncbi:hypothetical protein GCM10007148_11770 [Parvularcula lutaonensis]|nr:hypothetical protein GCM10007148_11770 [Parvularcula lutaonensis]
MRDKGETLPKVRPTGRDLWLLGMFAVLPVLGFQFGIGNQVEQLPLVARILDPEFAAGDFYLDHAMGFGPRIYYAWFLAGLSAILSAPGAVFFLAILSNFATGVVSYLACRRLLGASAFAGMFAAALAVLNSSFALGLAGYVRFDSFQPASLAIPLALFGVLTLFEGKHFQAAAFFAAGSLFHPLIGTEIGLMAFGSAGLAGWARGGFRPGALFGQGRLILGGIAFLTAVFLLWALPGIGDASERLPDAEFFDILISFRAPHHYLLLGQPRAYVVSAAVFVAVLGSVMFLFWRERRELWSWLPLLILFIATLAACGLSLLMVDVLESRTFATAQLLRLLILVKWTGFLFFGWLAAKWVAEEGIIGWAFALTMLLATAETQPIVLGLLLTAAALLNHPRARAVAVASPVIAAGAVAASLALIFIAGSALETTRMLVAAAGLLTAYGIAVRERIGLAEPLGIAAAFIAFALVNKHTGWTDFRAFNPVLTWADHEDPEDDIARWARDNTPEGSIFITPPDMEAFRMLSQRGIVVDYTSIPFSDQGLQEWRSRMRTLYGATGQAGGFRALRIMRRNYHAIDPVRLRRAMSRYGADFAVLYADTEWDGAVLYANEEFKVVAP